MGYTSEATPTDRRQASFDPETGGVLYARDEDYYLDTLAFLVEDCLFNIPSYKFDGASLDLSSKISATLGPHGKQMRPVVLDDVKHAEFKCLLRVLYPKKLCSDVNSAQDWISVLHLASRWELADVRELAIAKISSLPLDPVEKIAISSELGIPGWLETACETLAVREQTLSLDEAKRIGIEVAVRVFHLRERAHARTSRSQGSSHIIVPASLGCASNPVSRGFVTMSPAKVALADNWPPPRPKSPQSKPAMGPEFDFAPELPSPSPCEEVPAPAPACMIPEGDWFAPASGAKKGKKPKR